MKSLIFLTFLLVASIPKPGHAEPGETMHRDPSPPAGTISQTLFWIADTVKMDRFLAQIDMANIRDGSYRGEVLPDTRVAWRDYDRQARTLAAAGHDDAAILRIWQMLKLAAIYREFGGLQNVVQGEEIRSLAGVAARDLHFGGRINSPDLEYSVEECIDLIERKAGLEKSEVRPSFWQHLIETAGISFTRLATPSTITVQTSAPNTSHD